MFLTEPYTEWDSADLSHINERSLDLDEVLKKVDEELE